MWSGCSVNDKPFKHVVALTVMEVMIIQDTSSGTRSHELYDATITQTRERIKDSRVVAWEVGQL